MVRRLIPNSNGTLRPRGLPALEATIGATAVAILLAAIDAQDVCDGCDGCRPGRRPHQALHAVRPGRLKHGIGAVIDGDRGAFVDHVPHDTRCTMRRQRSKDGRVLEWIERWLHAGILDGKAMVVPAKGSPQGSVRSPL